MVVAGPRVYAKMTEDGLFPLFLRTSRERPAAAMVPQAVAVIIVVWLSGLAELFNYIGFTIGVSAAVTVSVMMLLRLCEGAERVRARLSSGVRRGHTLDRRVHGRT